MRKSDTIAISVALVGVAMAILAWLASPATIDYEVRFALVLSAVIFIIIAVGLPIRASLFERSQRMALNGLSGDIDWAIHNLLNRPRPQLAQMDEFAVVLDRDFHEWCARVDGVLKNESFFTQSDLIRFQRLGFIEPVRVTGHAATDHTFSMLKLKLKRLQEVIDLVQQRPW